MSAALQLPGASNLVACGLPSIFSILETALNPMETAVDRLVQAQKSYEFQSYYGY